MSNKKTYKLTPQGKDFLNKLSDTVSLKIACKNHPSHIKECVEKFKNLENYKDKIYSILNILRKYSDKTTTGDEHASEKFSNLREELLRLSLTSNFITIEE